MQYKILSIVVFFSALINAQINIINNDSFNELSYYVLINNDKYSQVKGSRFLNEEFVPSKINNLKYVYPVRFNVVENLIEVKKGDGKIIALNKSELNYVRLLDGSNKLFRENFYITETERMGRTFFELLHKDENFELYLKERIRFLPKKPSKSSYEPEVPAKFLKQDDKYYFKNLKLKDTILREIPMKKRIFLKEFSNDSPSFKTVVKRNKLDSKENLIKIFEEFFDK